MLCFFNAGNLYPLNVISVVITANLTDVAEDVPIPDSGKEYPLQRDEVKSTLNKVNRNTTGASTKSGTNEEPKHYIGFVIGILSVVILILVSAIVFIVFRNQRLKTTTSLDAVERTEKPIECDKVSALSQRYFLYSFYFMPLSVSKGCILYFYYGYQISGRRLHFYGCSYISYSNVIKITECSDITTEIGSCNRHKLNLES